MSKRIIETKSARKLHIVYRVLLGIAALMALVLVAGSIYAILRGPLPEAAGPESETVQGEAVFGGIGQIRVRTAEPGPATVIVSIAFPYPSEDAEFSGEIAIRARSFRDAAAAYFSEVSAADLRGRGEDTIKTDILALFNGNLRLGQIEKLYFNDYMIIE